ncbi:MAG: hypothetical protein J5J00_06080 [Deltaproteobacteria bacterium]|nr:hypothetical protein [Deltaproteobacteria bacterium]
MEDTSWSLNNHSGLYTSLWDGTNILEDNLNRNALLTVWNVYGWLYIDNYKRTACPGSSNENVPFTGADKYKLNFFVPAELMAQVIIYDS